MLVNIPSIGGELDGVVRTRLDATTTAAASSSDLGATLDQMDGIDKAHPLRAFTTSLAHVADSHADSW